MDILKKDRFQDIPERISGLSGAGIQSLVELASGSENSL